MSEDSRPQVEVAVALVTNQRNQILLVLNDRWNSFTVPMTKRRRGRSENEPITRAAIRAAVEAVGVPVRLIEDDHKRLPTRLQSGRHLAVKDYIYEVFHVESHPDFADRLQVRQPHLWLSPHLALSGYYEPISESARTILSAVLKRFKVPARIQRTSVLILRRDHSERGLQFLVRRDPDWGYALPSKRWGPVDPANSEDPKPPLMAAERVAREELGLEPGTDVTITPARSPEFTTHGVSATQGAPAFGADTDYIHSVFDAQVSHSAKFQSDAALAWVTSEEIRYLRTSGSHGEPGAPSGRPGPISRTTYDILLHLGLSDVFIGPEVRNMAHKWLREHEGDQGSSDAKK